MPTLLEDIAQIEQQTVSKFPSEVVKIRHYIGEDWAGNPSITFRIVLSDDVVRRERLWDTTEPVRQELFEGLRHREFKYYPYFEFRSKAEQDVLKDPTWD